MRGCLALLLCLCPAFGQEYTTTMLSRHILTNDGVIQLAKAGFDELFVIERIKPSRTRFDTSVEGLVTLKQAGISEDLIRTMALEDRRNYPTPMASAPAAGAPASTIQPVKSQPFRVMVEKHWWGFRWRRVE